jgi:hypothetical protein
VPVHVCFQGLLLCNPAVLRCDLVALSRSASQYRSIGWRLQESARLYTIDPYQDEVTAHKTALLRRFHLPFITCIPILTVTHLLKSHIENS